jgi:flagellar hook-basal body complex protein FliE
MPIESIFRTAAGIAGAAAGSAPAAGAAPVDGSGFAHSLESLVNGVEGTAADANTAITNMVSNNGDVHDAMIALQRSEMALELTVQVRNKFVQAYQDIMRMPL